MSEAEIAASMARIKALQDSLAGGGAINNNDTEEDEEEEMKRQFEEQERRWQAEQEHQQQQQQQQEQQNAKEQQLEQQLSNSLHKDSVINNSSSSRVPLMCNKPNVASWDNADAIQWLEEMKAKLLGHGEMFLQKGWTQEELNKWINLLNTSFNHYITNFKQNNIDGKILAEINEQRLKELVSYRHRDTHTPQTTAN
jgi:flagellar biosynthesis GTPase FlhF